MTDYILINVCHGGFAFSDEFKETYKRTYPDDSEDTLSKAEGCFRTVQGRGDSKILSVVHELGLVKSADSLSKFELYPVVKELIPFVKIHEYDGYERVEILYDRAYAQLLHRFMSVSEDYSLDWLARSYTNLERLEKCQREMSRDNRYAS